MGVISQNALSLITAPPSGGNSGRQRIIKIFGRCDLHAKFGEFWGMFRRIICNTIGSLQVPCSGPNNHP